jgi:DNA-directed RNA polymerase subunit RPC12/RpoP
MDPSIPVIYQCATCGEENEIILDLSAGMKQELTEDCAICCRPNILSFSIDYDGNVALSVESDE